MKGVKKKIVVTCGSGGVGKTTLAAAIALQGALDGKKTIVLTIDPAKRLATSLGLTSLTDEPTPVPDFEGVGSMEAMMLDTKRTFDRLIEKYAPPERRERIFQNQLYQELSNMIGGSQEYMAMERLYELHQKSDYDLMVLDTPPTRHALDFLEAPRKMMNITGNSLLKWFLKPGLLAGRIGFGTFKKGAEKILAVLDQLAGFAFLYELSEMLSLLESLLKGFHDRAGAVYELLRQDFVGFLLVTTPQSQSIDDALFFYQKIEEYKLPFVGFVVNRVHSEFLNSRPEPLPSFSSSLREKILANYHNYQELAERDQNSINLLKKIGRKKGLWTVPLQLRDIHRLEDLKTITEFL